MAITTLDYNPLNPFNPLSLLNSCLGFVIRVIRAARLCRLLPKGRKNLWSLFTNDKRIVYISFFHLLIFLLQI